MQPLQRHFVFLVIFAWAFMLSYNAFAQDDVITLTPTPDQPPTATQAPLNTEAQTRSINPQPNELPVITQDLSINVAGRDGYIITDFSPIFVREGDDVEFRPLAVVQGGVFLEATGVNDQQTWWRVRTANNAFEGWINAEFLILRGNLTDVPVIPSSQMGNRLPITFVTFAPQELHNEPSDSFETFICNITPDEDLLLGRDRTGSYYQIAATCEDGTARIGYISAEAGALRNPTDAGIPIVGLRLSLPDEADLNNVRGPALLVFQQQTIYETLDFRTSTILCDIAPNRYPIVARNTTNEFYLVRARCLDGRRGTGWIPADAGAFQTTNQAGVPVAVTPSAPMRSIPEREPRFVTSVPQQLTAAPDSNRVLCSVQPGEQQVIARTGSSSHFQVSALCANGSIRVGWLAAETGAFRNPFEKNVPVAD